MAALTENQYTYTGSSTYLSGITDPNSVSLTGGDSAFGSWSGWMFTVNGEMPIERYDNGQPIYATLGTYQLKDGDVVRMYYVACPTESGQHTWDDGQVTTAATCTENGVMTYTCTMCSDTKTEVIPATGHAYGEPVWSWTDGFKATATFTCTNDPSHVKNVTATVTNAVTTEATCESTGVRTYTAKVTFDGKDYTDTKTEVIPALGHDYKDGKCSRCGAEEPTTPVEPGKPGDSGKPTTPEKPAEPSQPTTPATGDSSNMTALWVVLAVAGLGIIALVVLLVTKRKNKKD